tara:strand:- start:16891 stop:17136 length:246 start_codon:yes stop_codon:yes gene_type:complete
MKMKCWATIVFATEIPARWISTILVSDRDQTQCDVSHVVRTLRFDRHSSRLTDCWQNHRGQDSHNDQHNQQFNEGNARAAV